MAKAFWTTAFLFASLLLWPQASRAAIIHVPEDHKGIQQAVDMAATGDEVIVGPGTYRENILITKPVVLRSSAGATSTIIEASDEGAPAIKVDKTSGVKILGFSATGSQVAGIFLAGSTDVAVSDCLTAGNTSGIVMNRTTGSSIIGCVSNSNAQYGLYMEKSHDNRIERNTASLNQDKGFFISNSNNNTIAANSVNLNSWDGIMLYASTGNTVTGNKTLRNTYGLVISESPGNEVSDNTTVPNLFLILPIALIYLGVVSYLIQRNILKAIYKE